MDATANDGTDATANGRKGVAKERVTTPQVLPLGGPGAGAGTAAVIIENAFPIAATANGKTNNGKRIGKRFGKRFADAAANGKNNYLGLSGKWCKSKGKQVI